MAENKKFLDHLKHFGPYIALFIGLAILSLLKGMSWVDVGKIIVLIIASLLVSWAVFFSLDIGILKVFHDRRNEQLSEMRRIVDNFVPTITDGGIIPTFNDDIVPGIRKTSQRIETTSDKLAEILQVKQLINRFVLFQGTKDYSEALLKAIEGTPVHQIRFMGTFIGARALLSNPIIDHIKHNPYFRTLDIIASKNQQNGSDLSYYAVNFTAGLAQSILEDKELQDFRQELSNRNQSISVRIKYLENDIFASVLIIGDKLFILAPTHGLGDFEQVVNFNFGLIVPREDSTGINRIWGNDIIERQIRIFDETFANDPSEIWRIHHNSVAIDKSAWSYDGNTFDFSTPNATQIALKLEELKLLGKFTHDEGHLIDIPFPN